MLCFVLPFLSVYLATFWRSKQAVRVFRVHAGFFYIFIIFSFLMVSLLTRGDHYRSASDTLFVALGAQFAFIIISDRHRRLEVGK